MSRSQPQNFDAELGRRLSRIESGLQDLRSSVLPRLADHRHDEDQIEATPAPNLLMEGATDEIEGQLTLTSGANENRVFIDASWDSVANVQGYEVELLTPEITTESVGEEGQDVLTSYNLIVTRMHTVDTSVRFEPVEPMTSYTVRVFIRHSSMSSAVPYLTGEVTTGKDETIPEQVTGLSVGAGYKTITAVWDEVSDADVRDGNGQYEIDIATNAAFTEGLRTQRVGGTIASFGDLAPGTLLYVRVRAVDSSGNLGPYSDTETATPGDVEIDVQPSDGDPPSSSPTPTVTAGIGFLVAEWLPVENTDPITYHVHISTTNNFTPNASTKHGEISGTTYFLFSTAGGTSLVSGTTYYVKIVATDADGAAAPGSQGSGDPVGQPLFEIGPGSITETHIADDSISTPKLQAESVTAGKMVVGTITAASGILADAVITTAKIADLAVNTAKIGNAQITTAKIADLAVSTAKIANAAIQTAKIGDAQITTAKIADLAVDNAKIATAAITTVKIGNAQVINAKIESLMANKLTTDTLTATTITLGTGGILRAGNLTNGVYFDSLGIKMYKGGQVTVDLPVSGDPTFSGNIVGATIALYNNLFTAQPPVYFNWPTTTTTYSPAPTGWTRRGSAVTWSVGSAQDLRANGAALNGTLGAASAITIDALNGLQSYNLSTTIPSTPMNQNTSGIVFGWNGQTGNASEGFFLSYNFEPSGSAFGGYEYLTLTYLQNGKRYNTWIWGNSYEDDSEKPGAYVVQLNVRGDHIRIQIRDTEMSFFLSETEFDEVGVENSSIIPSFNQNSLYAGLFSTVSLATVSRWTVTHEITESGQVRADHRGLWVGSEQITTAPARIDAFGNAYFFNAQIGELFSPKISLGWGHSANLPIKFQGTEDGFYSPQMGNITIVTDGRDRVSFSAAGVTVMGNNRLYVPAGGTQTNPVLRFGTTATGWYFTGNEIRGTVNGLAQFAVGPGYARLYNGQLRLTGDGTAASPDLTFVNDSATGMYYLGGAGDQTGIYFTTPGAGWRGGFTVEGLRLHGSSGALYSGAFSSNAVFDTNTNGFYLNAANNYIMVARNGGVPMFVGRNGSNGTSVGFYRSGTLVGTISVTTAATSYNTSSDHRLKDKIHDFEGAMELVKELHPVEFEFRSERGVPHKGFLAHEVQEILPDVVTGKKDEVDEEGEPVVQMIDHSKMVPVLTKALQELDERLQALERAN
jgi:hypothetical protein